MLTHALFGAGVALAWFCAINLTLTALLLSVLPFVRRRLQTQPTPRLALALRLLPAAGSFVIVAAGGVPAYVLFEPRGVREGFGIVASALIVGGACLILAAVVRATNAHRRTAGTLRAKRAVPIAERGGVPLLVVETREPFMWLAGVWRPRVYISRAIVDALTPEELDRAVAHELAHHQAADNAKRRAIACAPDLLWLLPAGRALERHWRDAAELDADAAAGATSDGAAVLASALVKVARLAAGSRAADLPCAAFHDQRPIADRVRRLLAVSSRQRRRHGGQRAGAALLLTAALAGLPALLPIIHSLTERLVRLP